MESPLWICNRYDVDMMRWVATPPDMSNACYQVYLLSIKQYVIFASKFTKHIKKLEPYSWSKLYEYVLYLLYNYTNRSIWV